MDHAGGVHTSTEPTGRRIASLCAVLVTAAWLSAGSAPVLAKSPGIIVDPNSPAGKEYAIPLVQARRAAGVRGSGSSGDQPAAGASDAGPSAANLFGAGITPTTGLRRSRGHSAASSPPVDRRPGLPAQSSPADTPTRVDRGGLSAANSGSAVATTGLIAGAVLLLGGLLGVVIRRRSESPTH